MCRARAFGLRLRIETPFSFPIGFFFSGASPPFPLCWGFAPRGPWLRCMYRAQAFGLRLRIETPFTFPIGFSFRGVRPRSPCVGASPPFPLCWGFAPRGPWLRCMYRAQAFGLRLRIETPFSFPIGFSFRGVRPRSPCVGASPQEDRGYVASGASPPFPLCWGFAPKGSMAALHVPSAGRSDYVFASKRRSVSPWDCSFRGLRPRSLLWAIWTLQEFPARLNARAVRCLLRRHPQGDRGTEVLRAAPIGVHWHPESGHHVTTRAR